MGRDRFISLMKAGLIYDRSKGFKAEADADLATIASILKTALGGDFEFVPKCFVCNSSVECYLCAYCHICDVKSSTPNCLCDKCMDREDAFAIYSRTLNSRTLMKKIS
ncbi:MAG: hypothetical protein H3Z50_00150 [archaeon]|nr:hypothetical protein [archaeon]